MKLQNDAKRLLIYFFYDKDGIVDNYISYMLDNLVPYVHDIVIVCNGKLNQEGRIKFSKYTNKILVRENKGYDVWAYKTALETYGWKKIYTFDELILMNFTIMGPLYPFEEMFNKMKTEDIDFWGITKYHKVPFDPFHKIKYGYIPEHIQSHFIAIRKNMLKSVEFRKYWKNMPEVNNYDEAVSYHEAIFTKEFAEKGFTWKVYVNTDDMEKYTYYPLLMAPVKLVRDKKCPIIKKRSFFHETTNYLDCSNGDQAALLMNFIKNNLNYDINLIWDNILRINNQADIKRCLELNYILPKNIKINKNKEIKRKVALVMHIYFEDLIDYCFNYATSMPDYCDIYITTNTQEKKEKIKKIFSKISCRSLEIIVIENRGRDVSALLVATKKFIMNYDYVCFAHDKKVTQLDLGIKGAEFSEKCFRNILGSKDFVENIITTFEENPRLGLLTPPPPNHADYYPTLGGFDWGPNYDATKKLAEDLKLTVDIDNTKGPVAPLGTMFWFRPKAMQLLFNKNWEYKDFPKEPNNIDGTILHAIERIYPFVVQQEGYYPAWILNDEFAQTEITNLHYMLCEVNKCIFSIYGPNSLWGTVTTVNYFHLKDPNQEQSVGTRTLAKMIIKRSAQKYLPDRLYQVGVKVKKKLFK